MSSKIIAYDLCGDTKDYNELYEYLMSFKSHVHINESVWMVTTNKNHGMIYDELTMLLDSNDRVFVAELTGNASWNNAICTDDALESTLDGIR
jgi:hypothetical protein